MVRNLILRYSKEWDTLLDPMVWGGTTAIECKLLGRKLIAFDVNPLAIELTKNALNFGKEDISNRFLPSQEWQKEQEWKDWQKWQKEEDEKGEENIQIHLWDARKLLQKVKGESIDFVLMHPPYADIIAYSEGKIEDDLSNIHNLDDFADEIQKIAKESLRVLKPWKYCAILMGDTRRKKMYKPLAFKVMQKFLKEGFELKEDIVKVQHNCKATGFWVKKSKDFNFLLIMHEHLFIFQKS